MRLLNISIDRNLPRFKEIFSDLEDSSGLELVFIYAFGEQINTRWLVESMDNLNSPEDKEVLPIILYGKCEHLSYSAVYAPTFTFAYKAFKDFDRNIATLSPGDLPETLDIYDAHNDEEREVRFTPINAPSGNTFGFILYDEHLSYPVVYINSDFVPSTIKETPLPKDEVSQQCFKNLVHEALHLLVEGHSAPEYGDEDYEFKPDKEVIDNFISTLNKGTIDQIKRTEQDIDHVKNNYINTLRRYEELKAKLNTSITADVLDKQLEIINNMDRVVWADISRERYDGSDRDFLRILTVPLEIDTKMGGRKAKFDLGAIFIRCDIQNGRVYVDNMTRRIALNGRGYYSHPHDMGGKERGGYLCLGEIEAYIPKLVTQFEFAALAELLINFMESVNLRDSAGRNIPAWPRKH